VATGTVRVHGLRELNKAFRNVEKDLRKELREELRGVGRIVANEAAGLFAPIDPGSASGFKVRVRQRGVAVEQSKRRTTGAHPEYGGLQMRKALLPALERKEPEVVRGLEGMLDRLGRGNGF
jgi:hypothetical protein